MSKEQTIYVEYYIPYLYVANNGISRDFLDKFTYGECLINEAGHKTNEYSTEKVLKFGRKTQFQMYFKEIYYRLKMTNRMGSLISLKEKLVQLVGDFNQNISLDEVVDELTRTSEEDIMSVTGISLENLINGLRILDDDSREFLFTVDPNAIERFVVDKKQNQYYKVGKNSRKNKGETIK